MTLSNSFGTSMKFFERAAVLDVVLIVINSLGIMKPGLLPLGGGEIQQLGILFSVVFIVQTIWPWFRQS